MRLTLAVLAALAALAIIPSIASASTPPDEGNPLPNSPCAHGNPTDLCGDRIVVRPATTDECENGGIVIIIIRGERDDLVTVTTTPPRDDPEDDEFPVCNGEDGEQGPPGETPVIVNEPRGINCPTGGIKITLGGKIFYVCNGEPGAPGDKITVVREPAGTNCPTGGIKITDDNGTPEDTTDDESFFVCNGLVGPAGPQGPAGPAGPTGPAGPAGPPPCISTRIAKWRIILRNGLRFRLISAQFEGTDAQVNRRRTPRGRRMLVVSIDSRGLPRGIYFARIIYRVNGRRGTRHHGFRFCYGNPKGGGGEGPNRFPIDVIVGRDRRQS